MCVLPTDFGDESTVVYKQIDFFLSSLIFFSPTDFGNKSARAYKEHIDFGSTGKAFLKSIKCVCALSVSKSIKCVCAVCV